MKQISHSASNMSIQNMSSIRGLGIEIARDSDLKSRGSRVVKLVQSLHSDPAVINDYSISRDNNHFNIQFNDGRAIIWQIDRLPADWIDTFWRYATKPMPQLLKRFSEGPGCLFDSTA